MAKQGMTRIDEKIVLVILNYNDANTCLRLLKHVIDYDVWFKVLIVDNHSTDQSYDILKKYQSEKVVVIKCPQNNGYAAGNNYGVRYAIREWDPTYIYIANPDVLFEENVIIKLSDIFRTIKDVAVVAPIVERGYNVWDQPDYGGIIAQLFLILFNLQKRNVKKKLLRQNGRAEVGVVEGSFFGMTVDAYKKINGFDEKTFLYCEENILGYRLKQQQLKTYVDSSLTYQHIHGNSIRKEYKGKAKAFPLFYQSFKIYLVDYLKIGRIKQIIFEFCYRVGYAERVIFDLMMKGKSIWKNQR